ncbi:MAG: hypothetical protein EA383_12340 [Spirochaetaceae bacterium]|nr:MAG: hypothetical protein EA383_12340 [Spirochaetaceae bacterium]
MSDPVIAGPTWYETFEIGSFWTDVNGVASPQALLQMMQDVAWKHAQALKFGYSELGAQNQFWVLSRLTMDVRRYPRWGETVRLESWTSGTNKLLALRDFRLYDDDERELMKGVTGWLIVDHGSRRPLRPEGIVAELSIPSLPSQYDGGPEKVRAPDSDSDGQTTYGVAARYSDIDAQQHVNNTRYVSWMIDGLSADWVVSRRIRRMSVNFLKECNLGDTLRIAHECLPERDQTRHSVLREADGQYAAHMQLHWDTQNTPVFTQS